MKILTTYEAKNAFPQVLKLSKKDVVIVTNRGKPVAAIEGLNGEEDLEDYLLERSPKFWAMIRRARRGKGVSIEGVCKRLGLAKGKHWEVLSRKGKAGHRKSDPLKTSSVEPAVFCCCLIDQSNCNLLHFIKRDLITRLAIEFFYGGVGLAPVFGIGLPALWFLALKNTRRLPPKMRRFSYIWDKKGDTSQGCENLPLNISLVI